MCVRMSVKVIHCRDKLLQRVDPHRCQELRHLMDPNSWHGSLRLFLSCMPAVNSTCHHKLVKAKRSSTIAIYVHLSHNQETDRAWPKLLPTHHQNHLRRIPLVADFIAESISLSIIDNQSHRWPETIVASTSTSYILKDRVLICDRRAILGQ